MNFIRVLTTTLFSGLLLAAAGCSSTSTQPATNDSSVFGGSGTAGNTAAPGAMPSVANVYFDYRQSMLDGSDKKVLDGWVAYFKANPGTKASIEGHGDERGSDAINTALGNSRASNVRSYLVSAGIPGSQLSVTSHGKSKPVAKGHDESAWSQNRRVEIVLR